jgi:hypothetical protein
MNGSSSDSSILVSTSVDSGSGKVPVTMSASQSLRPPGAASMAV